MGVFSNVGGLIRGIHGWAGTAGVYAGNTAMKASFGVLSKLPEAVSSRAAGSVFSAGEWAARNPHVIGYGLTGTAAAGGYALFGGRRRR